MMIATSISKELADAITEVVNELASELDLHYDDQDLVACAITIEKMNHLVTMLQMAGYPAPEAYTHIVTRYHNSLN